MPEVTYSSAGVYTREIDLSQPTTVGPVGTPAGVIGTAYRGPAFVPVTVANYNSFVSIFGAADGSKFGPLAVNEFLRNAQALTYIRVLGVGDGKTKSSTTGQVTNSGFTVGSKQVQAGGTVTSNPYATNTGNALGRTHFLGVIMSESNGSTIFSDAGINNLYGVKSAEATILITGASTIGQVITIISTDGTSKSYLAADAENLTADPPEFDCNSGSDQTIASSLEQCIDSATGHRNKIRVSRSTATLTLTQESPGTAGNTTITSNLDEATVTQWADGTDGPAATPIIRGIIMAPAGVIPKLSGNFIAQGSAKPSDSATFTVGDTDLQGGLTGSVNIATSQFTLLLNGHKSTGEWPSVHTCSFETISGQYFSNILNKDPLKIEEAGHLLYAHYDIHPSLAVLTGSGILTGGIDFGRGKPGTHEEIAFLTSGTLGRDTSGTYVPNYENFKTRFKTPASPFITSQKYGASPHNLFRIHSLDDGVYANTLFKIMISNITPAREADSYGTFSLTVRDFNDNDYEKVPLETYNGLTLDPGSDRYIARMIGDMNAYFDFDQAKSAQKMVVVGDHPVRSSYVRVEMGANVKNGTVPKDALPVGFRGPTHLVTSGTNPLTSPASGKGKGVDAAGDARDTTMLMSGALDVLKRAVEPPIMYRKSVAVGEGINKLGKAGLCWGVQFETVTSLTTPNALTVNDPTIASRSKFFPQFHPTSFNFAAGNNAGKADSQGTVLDSDRFNRNIFSLERVKLRTGSISYNGVNVADIDQWASASYVRDGVMGAVGAGSTNETNKTRGFKIDDLKSQGNRSYLQFTTIMQGGYDGLNIFNKDSLNLLNASAKREIDDSSNQGGYDGPTVIAYRKAIDIMGTKSDVEVNLIAIPGLRHKSVTDYAISAVESRFDSMYVMDIEERDELNSVVTSSVGASINVTNTVNSFAGRGLNSSFAAAYFPDVVIQEPTNLTNVQVPPSVVVLGALAQNDVIGFPWFAPAGFSRGALGNVIQTSVMFNKANLDTIYDNDINPITEPIPGAGLVVWGQKTLLATASALDRVNVRRLLIYIRRKVRDIANLMLFEPNRQETLDKFSSLVQPILQTIQERSGVDRYKVIIDATTTTQADVENNTLRGKIFIQPTRTAEFIALDFVVTNAGDAFTNA